METLEIQDVHEMQKLIGAIEKGLSLKKALSEKVVMQISIKINNQQNTIFTSTINNPDINLPEDSSWKKEFHEIGKDYIATLQVHANTMIQCRQEKLLELLLQTDKFQIELINAGSAKLYVIKLIKDFTRLGLKECKEIADLVPCIIKKTFDKIEAEQFVKELSEAGAIARFMKANMIE